MHFELNRTTRHGRTQDGMKHRGAEAWEAVTTLAAVRHGMARPGCRARGGGRFPGKPSAEARWRNNPHARGVASERIGLRSELHESASGVMNVASGVFDGWKVKRLMH